MQQRSPSAVADGFVPARLTIARNARGLKQIDLAAAIDRTPATVSKWESDAYSQAPDRAAVTVLATLLSVRESWFYKPLTADAGVAFFRSLKSELTQARDRVGAKLQFTDEIFQALLERVEFPPIDIPDVMGSNNYKMLTAEAIDRLATEVREYWGLGDDPIEDMMVVIENAGVAVAEDFVDSIKLDGVSKWIADRPVMLLARDKEGGVRRRFDAAHELGHLIMHRTVREEDLRRDLTVIEEQAMAFAGAFLLPASSFAGAVEDVTLDSLADLKPTWKVSIGAMVKRLKNLNLITADHERNLWKYYSYRQWRGREPYDDRIAVESPINMRAAIEMLIEDGPNEVTSLIEDIGLIPKDISQLTGVDIDALIVDKPIRPRLRIVRREPLRGEAIEAAND